MMPRVERLLIFLYIRFYCLIIPYTFFFLMSLLCFLPQAVNKKPSSFHSVSYEASRSGFLDPWQGLSPATIISFLGNHWEGKYQLHKLNFSGPKDNQNLIHPLILLF